MSATDLEYLKFLQDNRGELDVTNGSFFRSMVNVEVGGIQHNENTYLGFVLEGVVEEGPARSSSWVVLNDLRTS